jgi:hypothetical protein
MIRHSIFFAVLAMNVSTIPALASQCATANEIAASPTRWAAVRRQSVNAANHDTACRAFFAASFYESVATRQAATRSAHAAEIAANRAKARTALRDKVGTAFSLAIAALAHLKQFRPYKGKSNAALTVASTISMLSVKRSFYFRHRVYPAHC